MRAIVLLSSFIILTGCMAGSLEAQKPIYSGHSNKNIDELNRCIAPKQLELNSSSTRILITNGYKVVASKGLLGILSIAKIESNLKGGSDVNVHAVARGGNEHWEMAARSCM